MSSRALRPYLLDAGLAATLAAASVLVGTGYYFGGPVEQKLLGIFGDHAGLVRALVVWWLYGALLIAGLVIRQRWPLAALLLVGVGAVGHQLDPRFGIQPLDLAVPIAVYTVASLARARWISATALAVVLVSDYLLALRNQLLPEGAVARETLVVNGRTTVARLTEPFATTATAAAAKSFQVMLVLVLAFAIGDGVRSRRAHLRTLEQRAADLEREQHQRTALAAAAERARITRELHDVVAHGVSVMVVQAQGAAAALERHPERTAAALQNVIGTGRSSLAELRRLLGVVRRDPTDDPQLTPQHGVGALPALVDRVRAAGTPVRLHIDGEPVPLPASVDLSAYRIVQEALTNTLKHAGPGAGSAVRLGFAADRIEVEVTDDGVGGVPDRDGDGNGLRGIAERVGALGGELTVGPVGAGGFRVHARLPLEAGA